VSLARNETAAIWIQRPSTARTASITVGTAAAIAGVNLSRGGKVVARPAANTTGRAPLGGGLVGDRRQRSRVQRITRHRPGQVAVAVEGGVQRGGVRHLRLGHVIEEVRGREGGSAGAGDDTVLNRVVVRIGQRQQLVIDNEIGKFEFGNRAHGV